MSTKLNSNRKTQDTPHFKLKFYEMENNLFKIENACKLTDACTLRLLRRLFRHYHLKPIRVTFRGTRQKGRFWSADLRIKLPHNPSLHLVCHEFAHYHEEINERRNVKFHTKKFLSTLKKVIKYANAILPFIVMEKKKEVSE